MSELSFEQMLEESLKTIRNGEVVEGTVIDVKEDEKLMVFLQRTNTATIPLSTLQL